MAIIFRSDITLSSGTGPRIIRKLANHNVVRYYSASRAEESEGSPVSDLLVSGGANVPWSAPSTSGSPTLKIDSSLHMPYLSFDGVNDQMTASLTPQAQPKMMMVIARLPVLPPDNTKIVNFHTIQGGRGIEVDRHGNLSVSFPSRFALNQTIDTNWHVYTLVVDGSDSYVEIDGKNRFVGNFGAGDAAGFTVGRTTSASTAYSQIDVAEVVMWPGVLNSIALNKEYRSIKAFYDWEF